MCGRVRVADARAQCALENIVFVLGARVALVIAIRFAHVARTLTARRVVVQRVDANVHPDMVGLQVHAILDCIDW